MTVKEIMSELQRLGSESIKKTLLRHGIKEPLFGVKIEHLKKIQQRIKVNDQLAKELYATGNADAMYLAGLIADDGKMTRDELQTWVNQAVSQNISEYTVPWVAAGSQFGFELGSLWINDKKEHVQTAGWATLGHVAALRPDADLDLAAFQSLLLTVEQKIHAAGNRPKYAMNGFVIAIGTYLLPLYDQALQTAKKIGQILVQMNGTACKVPSAADYIEKMKQRQALGKKKKAVKC